MGNPAPPITPDGRYLVVRGRLWRASDPALAPAEREALVARLMDARRHTDPEAEAEAHAAVDAAKHALGERGPVWWRDGAPDLNRRMARDTVYADWFASLPLAVDAPSRGRPGERRPEKIEP